MSSNTAAWLTGEKAHPFEVKEAPYPKPAADEIVVKSAAVAINPIDWKLQRYAFIPLKYPTILGEDVAGEVVAVGSNVTNAKKGDRVTGHAHGLDSSGSAASGAFQAYTLLNHKLVAVIPSQMSYERAAVLPLAISTAAAGLYQKDNLNLQRPSLDPKPAGASLLIWGGSSSVGALTIQFATASGYDVVTTASPRNFELVKALGAKTVFDYNSKSIIDELVDHFKGETVSGAFDAISNGDSTTACAEVLSRSKGGKFVACVLSPPEKLPDGITTNFMNALTILHNDISQLVWGDYVPKALEQGKLQAKPDPLIVGKSINDVQMAADRQAEGVSAAKIVCPI